MYFDSAMINVVEHCNLDCSYCYKKNKINNTMTEETAKATVDFFIQECMKNEKKELLTVFFGGEPTLNIPIINYIFDYALDLCRKNGIEYNATIITNCTIYTDEYEKFLLKWKSALGKIHVQLSIDGIPDIQDENRPLKGGGKSSPLVEATVKKYIDFANRYDCKLGDEIFTHSVVNKEALNKVYENYLYHRELGFPGVWIIPTHDVEWDDSDLDIYKSELIKVKDYIVKEVKETNDIGYYNSFSSLSKTFEKQPNKTCSAGYRLAGIKSNGDLYPCQRFEDLGEEYKLGDVFTGYDADKKQIYEDIISKNLLGVTSCGECNANTCRRCLAANEAVTGNMLLNPIGYCKMSIVSDEISVQLRNELNIDIYGNNKTDNDNNNDILKLIETINSFIDPVGKAIDNINLNNTVVNERLNLLTQSVNALSNVVTELINVVVNKGE